MNMQVDVTAMQAELDRLKAENTALKTAKVKPLSVKVSTKGGLSIYGLGRFPVTLYKSQWERLIAFIPKIVAAIEEHKDELTTKE